MDTLSTIAVNIDSKTDGITIALTLYSKGDKPNWLDERVKCRQSRHQRCQSTFASEAQTTGLRTSSCKPLFAVSSQKHSCAFGDTSITSSLIIKERRIQKIYSPSKLEVTPTSQIEVNLEGKHLIDILDDHKEERGKIMLFTNQGITISEAFDGDKVEQQLKILNNVDHDEYQNLHNGDFAEIIEHENWVPIVNVLNIGEREDLLI